MKNRMISGRGTAFLKKRDGVAAIEMGVLLAPMAFAGLFVLDIARAYIIGNALDGAAIDLVTRARAGQIANLNQNSFCKELKMSFCDMEKIGVRIEPLSSSNVQATPSPGEFAINSPGGRTSMLVRVSYHTEPVFRFGGSPDNYVLTAGAFTHVY